MISISEVLPEMIATIVGVGLGGMGALYNSRRQVNEVKQKRAKIFFPAEMCSLLWCKPDEQALLVV